MEYDIKRLDASKLTANITIEPDELAEEEAKVVKRLTKEAEIDGYRKGKAPEELIRKRYQESIRRDVSGKLIPLAWEDVAGEENIKPLEDPTYRLISYPDGGPLVFEAAAYLPPPVELGDTKKLKLAPRLFTISDEEVGAVLARIAEENAERKERLLTPAQEGDVVTFKWEGEPPAGGSKEEMEALIPTEKMTGSIGAQLIGVEKDAVRTITIKYEKDFPNPELAGKSANAKVRIVKVEERIVPAVDDELAKDLEFENLEVFKEAVKDDLIRSRSMEDRRRLRDQALEWLIAKSKTEIPKSLLEWARLGEQEGAENPPTDEQIINDLKARFIISALGQRYKIKIEEDELRLEVNAVAHQLGLTEVGEGFVRTVWANIYRRKALEMVVREALGEELPTEEKKGEEEEKGAKVQKKGSPGKKRSKK